MNKTFNISVYGSGYVGLVAAVSFASVGHKVLCLDTDESKISQLRLGIPHIYELGLPEMLSTCVKNQTIAFSSNLSEGIPKKDIIVLAVGTPNDGTGRADTSQLEFLAKFIAENISDNVLVINKSTAPPGTTHKLQSIIDTNLKNKSLSVKIYSNPEFLREGTALSDFIKPDRIVIGADDNTYTQMIYNLYAPFNHKEEKIIMMDTASAELTKYASNVFLATKISFMNELAILAEKLGANIHNIRLGMSKDNRIGKDFLYAGCGYGGACFPKDVAALKNIGLENSLDMKITTACEVINDRQLEYSFEKIAKYFDNSLKNKKIVVWGATFKPNTDDVRESPATNLIEKLVSSGADVSFYDSKAHFTNEIAATRLAEKYAFAEADALVIPTEWKEFWNIDFSLIKEKGVKVIFDYRNILDKQSVLDSGLKYIGIGV